MALALAIVIAFPVGIVAATRRNRPADLVIMGATQLGIAVPNFWFAMLLVLAFSLGLHWFSAGGFPGWNAGLLAGLKALTLPAIALALPQASILARVDALGAARHAARGLHAHRPRQGPHPRRRRCAAMRCATR